MLREFFETMEKNQSPRLTDSAYRKLLEKQKSQRMDDIIAGVGFGMLWILLFVIAAIF